MSDFWRSILIGGSGGAFAGVIVYSFKCFHSVIKRQIHKKRVYNWLVENTENRKGKEYRSTRAIASWNNMTEDRVRYICSIHKYIYLSTGKNRDIWGLDERESRTKYVK